MASSFSISAYYRLHIILIIRTSNSKDQIFKLNKEDRKGLAMIVDEQIDALESDDFSKGNHQIVKFKEMVRMLLFNNAKILNDR